MYGTSVYDHFIAHNLLRNNWTNDTNGNIFGGTNPQ